MSKKNFKHLVYGAKYKDRNGLECGPLIDSGSDVYPFECTKPCKTWTKEGRYNIFRESGYDLVELVSLPETQNTKRKVTDLGPNEVIHCATEAEDKAIRELLHAAGKKWDAGQSYLEITYWPGSDCYFPARGVRGALIYCKEEGYTIYPASDFLPQATPAAEPETEKVATTPEPQPFIPFEKGKANMAGSFGIDEERVEAIGVLVKAAFDAGPDIETALANASSIAKTPAEAFLVGIETRGYLKTGKKKKKKSDRKADEVAKSLQDALRKQGIIATVTAEKIEGVSGEDDCQCFTCRARRKADEHTHNPYAPVEPVNDAKGH